MTLVQEAMTIMEKMPKRNQQAVLDFLKAMGSQASVNEMPGKDADETMRNAALELAGLWKNRKDEVPVEEMIRSMRKGRRFDN